METGFHHVAALAVDLDAADPERLVEPRSRVLCAGLAVLAESTYAALGGRTHTREVSRAAALLSLWTKIDDQVIDGAPFHLGLPVDRLRTQTFSYLTPSFEAARCGATASREPRCLFAAKLGAQWNAIAGAPTRREAMRSWLDRGKRVQIDAVAALTRHPSEVSLAEIDRVSRDISAVWLLLIALVGTLPKDTKRSLSSKEIDVFFRAGRFIQRVDALVDLRKDLADGHRSSYPLKRLYDLDPAAFARSEGDPNALDAHIAERGIADECLASQSELEAWKEGLRELGETGPLLVWIHQHLAARYRDRIAEVR